MKQNNSDIILGIDPGTTVMGYGIIQISKKPKLIQLGVIRLKSYDNHYQKLQVIFESTRRIINTYRPGACSIEAPFYGKNVQSMLKLGRAQGTAIAAAMSAGVEVQEYSPKKIKLAVTGNGNASKQQVSAMLSNILKEDISKKIPLDATDGLAAAICHYYQLKNPIASSGKTVNNWADYVKNNPEKIKSNKR